MEHSNYKDGTLSEPISQPAGEAVTPDIHPFEDLQSETADPVVIRGGQVFLKGAVSRSSGVETFPAKALCPETGADDMEPALFGPAGTLYSFSTLHVSAARETPYTIGYVDLPSGLRILAHVRDDREMLACDMPVVLQSDGSGWWVEAGEAAA